jgi:hypothetical protein
LEVLIMTNRFHLGCRGANGAFVLIPADKQKAWEMINDFECENGIRQLPEWAREVDIDALTFTDPLVAPETTLEALAAAEWQFVDGEWTLSWDDLCDYDDGSASGSWTCWLSPEPDAHGQFEFEFEHSDRGGPQGGAVGADDIEAAKKSVRRYLEVWLDRWIANLDDARYRREWEGQEGAS